MPNLRSKTWTTTTPAEVTDAQFWEDHLVADSFITDTNSKLANIDSDGEISGEHVKYDSTTSVNDKIDDKQDILAAGSNITISGNTISATDTTYSDATTSASGLMSSADKAKLDGIAAGATANDGTVTSVAVKMNGTTAGTVTTSGEIDLGTVITAHQDISGKADASAVYTKSEVDTALSAKANQSTTYTKSEVDSLLDDKSEVAWNQITAAGTKIAEVTIDGTTTNVYAPTGGSGGSTDYTELTSKPQINSVELNGNKTSAQLGLADAAATYTKTEVNGLLDDKIDEPATEGTNGQALVTDGNGGRSWATVASENYIESVESTEFSVSNKKLSLASAVTNKLVNLDSNGEIDASNVTYGSSDVDTQLDSIDTSITTINSTLSTKANASAIDSWFGTATSSDGSTVSFSGIDNTKAYDLYADSSLVGITAMSVTSANSVYTVTYTLSGATAGQSFKLRQINN